MYEKSTLALEFRVVGARYMNAACVVMTQVAPGVCISPATQCLLCQGTVNLRASLQRVDILDAGPPGFAINQLL